MKKSYSCRVLFLFALCVMCMCTGCGKGDEGTPDPTDPPESAGHNFSKAVVEATYDANLDAIEGDGFIFSVDEETGEAAITSYNDVELLDVTLPDTVVYEGTEYLVTSIGESTFESDQSIEKLQLGKNIRSIEASAFYAADALREVIFTDSLKSIGEQAFSECPSLQEITWGSSVSSVGNAAFEGDEELRTLKLPSSVTVWGDEVFMDCTGLTECVFEEGSEIIGKGMFTNCSALSVVTIPDSVTMIYAEAFWDCSALEELSLPDSVRTIENQAFYSTAIQTLRIPSKLSKVDLGLLDGMDELKEISVPADRKKEFEETFPYYDITINTY